MFLYLLRHGRAAAFGTRGVNSDEERMLTEDGIEQLTKSLRSCVGYLAKPERILHSPYRRARESAEILASVTGFQAPLQLEQHLVPEADPATLMEKVIAMPASNATALVTHEPFVGRLLGLLLTGDPRTSIPFDVGTLVAVKMFSSTSMLGQLVFAKAVTL